MDCPIIIMLPEENINALHKYKFPTGPSPKFLGERRLPQEVVSQINDHFLKRYDTKGRSK